MAKIDVANSLFLVCFETVFLRFLNIVHFAYGRFWRVAIDISLEGGQQIENSAATGKHCTNYGAVVKALEQGAKAIDDLTDQTTDVVFLTDSRSALDALYNQSEPHRSRILHSIIEDRRVVLQWIPAHCGINGNEMADELANKGAAMHLFHLQKRTQSSHTASR